MLPSRLRGFVGVERSDGKPNGPAGPTAHRAASPRFAPPAMALSGGPNPDNSYTRSQKDCGSESAPAPSPPFRCAPPSSLRRHSSLHSPCIGKGTIEFGRPLKPAPHEPHRRQYGLALVEEDDIETARSMMRKQQLQHQSAVTTRKVINVIRSSPSEHSHQRSP